MIKILELRHTSNPSVFYAVVYETEGELTDPHKSDFCRGELGELDEWMKEKHPTTKLICHKGEIIRADELTAFEAAKVMLEVA